MAGALQQLVILVQDPGIVWRSMARFGEGSECALAIPQHIEVRDSEIAPGSGEAWFKRDGALPHRNCLRVAAAVIQQVTQIVRRMRIIRICLHYFADQDELFEAAGENVCGIGAASTLARIGAFAETTETIENVRPQIEQDGLDPWGGARTRDGEHRQRFVEEAGPREVEGQIEE